jgi:hypothetical protein
MQIKDMEKPSAHAPNPGVIRDPFWFNNSDLSGDDKMNEVPHDSSGSTTIKLILLVQGVVLRVQRRSRSSSSAK